MVFPPFELILAGFERFGVEPTRQFIILIYIRPRLIMLFAYGIHLSLQLGVRIRQGLLEELSLRDFEG